MTRKALSVLLLGATLVLAHSTQAQISEDRMRITTTSGEKIIGHLLEYDASSLILFAGSAEQRIAYVDMTELHRSLGRRSKFITGVMLGSIVGLLAGGLAANRIDECDEVTEYCGWDGLGQVVTVGGGIGLGVLGGLFVGRAIKTEKWERLDIPGQGSGLSVAPALGIHPTGRLTLGARISF